MTYELYVEQQALGTVTAESEGNRVRLTARCPVLGNGIYKAFLSGSGGQLSVGVMMPHGGEMTARRSVSSREWEALGTISRGEAMMTTRFGPATAEPVSSVTDTDSDADSEWLPERNASRLFSDPAVAALWADVQECYVKKANGGHLLAAVLQEKAPFSPVPMFCLGSPQTVRGKPCIVFRLNPAGHPIPME